MRRLQLRGGIGAFPLGVGRLPLRDLAQMPFRGGLLLGGLLGALLHGHAAGRQPGLCCTWTSTGS
ncbi:hypothetical protein ACFQY7_17415 [Actinomadura luteofluorescens]|uniref:hypothetical protein n=1 Tax=Actinomadura luteofluorescens TaxID=46163 RepID=UPI00363077BD